MNTLELNLKKKVLIVDLPIDAKNVYMSGNSIIYNSDKSCIVKPINDDYEFICKGSELTEEIASELVDNFKLDFNKSFYVFKDYTMDCNKFSKSIPSFISAVESKEKFWLENPIEKPINRDEFYKSEKVDSFEILLNEWQEAEEKTFKNPLIFVKNYVQ